MGKRIGIDLGTTYSCVAYVDDMGMVKVCDNQEGEQTTPSVVFFDPNGSNAVVGSMARSEGAMNPENICERVKNYMGDPSYKFFANGTEFSAAAVSTLILKKLISDAEAALGEQVDGVVITCPAYFGEEARNATKYAGESVILDGDRHVEVLKIMDEPTAAAIAYANEKAADMKKQVLIYDLGGGTFDCTVLNIDYTAYPKVLQVICTDGNHQLGGKDWDAVLADYVRNEFCALHSDCTPEDMENDPECRAWFSENIEKAKKALTKRDSTTLIPSFNGYKEKIEVTRAKFDELTQSLLQETVDLVDKMLTEKGLTMANDIDEIILVGGSTYMPQVKTKLEMYGKPLGQFEPNKAVAMGAALIANRVLSVSEAEKLKEQAKASGEDTNKFQAGCLSLGGTDAPVIKEICTKSYGFKFFREEKPVVYNIIQKGMEKPVVGQDGLDGLTFTGKHELLDSINVCILENDSLEQEVSLDECVDIYAPEPIKLAEAVYGDSPVHITLKMDANGIISFVLTEVNTGKEYEGFPKRLSDDANKAGAEEISKMSLM